jgi:cytochrome bd-type quinol oxidase subunit 2
MPRTCCWLHPHGLFGRFFVGEIDLHPKIMKGFLPTCIATALLIIYLTTCWLFLWPALKSDSNNSQDARAWAMITATFAVGMAMGVALVFATDAVLALERWRSGRGASLEEWLLVFVALTLVGRVCM